MTEVQWSVLQRDPKSVAALADQGSVRVRRRDGADLLLVRADQMSGAVTAARAVRSLFAHAGPDVAGDALLDEFPWVGVLPKSDRAEFVLEFVKAFQVSAELGNWAPLAQTVREWVNTAAIHADPDLASSLSEPVNGDFGPVPHPAED